MFKNPKIILILVLVVIICFLSLPLSVSRSIKAKLINISLPLLKVSGYLTQRISSAKSFTEEMFKAAKENKELREELVHLSSQVNQFKETRSENQRLKKILALKNSLSYKTEACRVIGRDAGTWFRTLIIDNGTKEKIRPDIPVVSVSGVIGRVISCSRNTATVLLITDTNSSIGGMVQDTRIVGLVEGRGTSECIFNYISKKADVPIGAAIITSGLGTIFPKGLVIGKIIEVSIDSQGLYKKAKLELAADINRVEEVLVIVRQ